MFEWDVNSNPVQNLYLSQDTQKLMEVVNNQFANVYTRCNVDDKGKTITEVSLEDCGQQVKWKVAYRIKRYARTLAGKTSVPYIFSPNFTFQLDFNYRAKQF